MEDIDIITLVTKIAEQREKIDKLQKMVDYLRKRIKEEKKGQPNVYGLQEL